MQNYRKSFMIFVILAAFAAIAAAYGYNSTAGEVSVVVAKSNIKLDQEAAGNLISSKIPRGALQMDTVRQPTELEGYSARGFIPAGTVLRKSMFQLGGGVSAKLKPDQVAIAVPTNLDTTCAEKLSPGNHVNIRIANKQGDTVTCQEIADNVEVISVNEKGVVLAVDKSYANSFILGKSQTVVLEILPSLK